MDRPHSADRHSPEKLVRRLDRWAGEMNALLAVLALGLAVLDLTCFTVLKIQDGPMTSMVAATVEPSAMAP